ncbi:10180_t:CDS:2, partial [Dentiscutata erythropus]
RIKLLLEKYSSVKNNNNAAFEITDVTSKLEHPLLSLKSLEFAFFRVLGIPSISKIIGSTGEMVYRCGKRYDDTDLIIREFCENPLDSERAETAIKRMNFIHKFYPIENKDMLYTLSLFICEPPKWINEFGWRKLTNIETEAIYEYWKEIGIRMSIKEIPPTYDDMVKFKEDFEVKYMMYNKSNPTAAEGTIRLFLSQVPLFLQPFARKVIYSLLDDHFLVAMGYPKQPTWLVFLIKFLLKTRALFIRHLMLPQTIRTVRIPDNPITIMGNNDHLCVRKNLNIDEMDSSKIYIPRFHPYENTYQNGYKIEELGPKKFEKGKLGKLGTIQPDSISAPSY